MAVLTVEYFNKIKDYIHPNVQTIIKDYQNGNVITLPPFHGCSHKNRNGTRKLIDYARGVSVCHSLMKELLEKRCKSQISMQTKRFLCH